MPDSRYVDSVRDHVLADLLACLSTELDHALSAGVRLFRDGQFVADAGALSTGDGESQHGEVRLRFRATGAPKRFLFFADSVFENDPRTPAFSGFFVRGDVQEIDGSLKPGFSSWVVKREEPEWVKWL